MALMEWNNLFNTNIKIVDEQHQGLVNILNSLYELMIKHNTSAELEELLEKLVDYTVYHFKTEEELFDKYGYPETEKHKVEHNNLTKQASELLNDYKSGKTVVTDEVINFLKDWLKNHIIHTDKRFGPFLNSKGVF